MEPRSRNRSTSFSGPEDWRNRNNLNTMSISEMFSELRDTFRSSDFDLVEQTLIAREEMLKEEIEKMKRELLLSAERMEFEKLERITVEFKLGKIQEEMKKKKLMKNGNERGNVVVAKNRVVGDGDGVGLASSDSKIAGENVRILVKEMVEELEKNNHLKSSGNIDYEIEVKTEYGKSNFEVLKNRGVGDVEAAAPAELVGVLAKMKKRYVGEPGKKRSGMAILPVPFQFG
ncbi:hypothetical protein TSUD_128920 [Trifolium subterraneum]|uniref:Uncharacterized protein n=1 Tax=Trifolium subterraneum TaxID=3900 RepID=A0A2Z6NBY9_TRISU|nr:hypothetical protein TSUD_128920 [Trifolium subterraneum]